VPRKINKNIFGSNLAKDTEERSLNIFQIRRLRTTDLIVELAYQIRFSVYCSGINNIMWLQNTIIFISFGW
jgi:hypothetical protein